MSLVSSNRIEFQEWRPTSARVLARSVHQGLTAILDALDATEAGAVSDVSALREQFFLV